MHSSARPHPRRHEDSHASCTIVPVMRRHCECRLICALCKNHNESLTAALPCLAGGAQDPILGCGSEAWPAEGEHARASADQSVICICICTCVLCHPCCLLPGASIYHSYAGAFANRHQLLSTKCMSLLCAHHTHAPAHAAPPRCASSHHSSPWQSGAGLQCAGLPSMGHACEPTVIRRTMPLQQPASAQIIRICA